MILQQTINGLMSGSAYALIALGFTLIFGILNVLHFAHPEVIMFGAYTVMLAMVRWHLPFLVALPMGMAVSAILGLLIERIVLRTLLFHRKRKSEHLSPLIATIGAGLFLQNLAVRLFTSQRQFFPDAVQTVFWNIGGVKVSNKQVMVLVVTLVLLLGLNWLVQRTRIGLAIRATSENADTASALGVSVKSIVMMVMVLASVLGATGGALLGTLYNTISPFSGLEFGLKGLIAMIVGGVGSPIGALIAALFIGVTESIAVGFLSSSWRDAIAFGCLLILLLARPSGLMGQRADVERRV